MVLRLNDEGSANTADAMDDLSSLYSNVSDEFTRRRVIRQTEDLADTFAKHITDELPAEYRALSEPDTKAAVAEAVAAAGLTNRLSPRERTQIIASPDPAVSLCNRLLDLANADLWESIHGETVSAFARLILTELCHSAIAAIRRSPALTVDMLVRLVQDTQRNGEMLSAIQEALANVPSRTAQEMHRGRSGRHIQFTEDYTLEYLRAVASQLDQIGLYGLDLDWEIRHYSLTTSYITLRLSRSGSSQGEMSLDEALRSRVVYLKGPAGSGKTTILQWLAVGLAKGVLPDEYSRVSARIPTLVRLRNFIDKPLPTVGEIADEFTQNLLLQRPDGWLAAVAKQRGFIVLVDGVDEFPESRTTELVTWLNRIGEALSGAKFVVTGRPSAYSVEQTLGAMLNRKMRTLEIQPMNRPEIRKFVLHWHKSTNRERQMGTHARSAVLVADKLSGSREYRQLSQTPLLCAALCALFYVKNGVLPSSRTEVYETLLRLLLSERDSQRGVNVDQSLDPQQRRFILEQLAIFMISNNLSEIPVERALMCVSRATERLPGSQDPQQILQWLLRRSGVIREPVVGQVDFVHRTFLEYLAASAHLQEDSIEALGSQAEDPNWAEAVILAGSLANTSQFKALVEVVVDGLDNAAKPPVWLTRIAAGILQTRVDRVEGATGRLESVLESSLPPSSEQEARAVVQAGDRMLPVLLESMFDGEVENGALSVPVSILRSVVRALGEDGGDEALDCLARLPAHLREQTLSELAWSWPAFDPSDFAERVLMSIHPRKQVSMTLASSSLFPHLRRLSSQFAWSADIDYPDKSFCEDVTDLRLMALRVDHVDALPVSEIHQSAFVEKIGEAETLTLFRCVGFAPRRVTQHPESVREIAIFLTSGDFDLASLEGAANLRELAIATANPARLVCTASSQWESNAWELPNSLSIAGPFMTEIPQISASIMTLRKTPPPLLRHVGAGSLQSLRIEEVTSLDLSLIGSAPNLREIVISNCSEVSDLSPLLALESLESLVVSGPNLVANSDVLIELKSRLKNFSLDSDPQSLFGQASY